MCSVVQGAWISFWTRVFGVVCRKETSGLGWFGIEQMCVDRVMQNYHLMNGRPSTAHLEYGAARLNREFSLAHKTRTTAAQYKIKKTNLDNCDENKGSDAGNDHVELYIWRRWIAQGFSLVGLALLGFAQN